MITIGVTGGIGSGKSTVCRMLQKRGARIFDADSVAKRLMTENPDLRRAIEAIIGPEAYRRDGSLDRGLMARRIFSDDALRHRVNVAVHPVVHAAFESAVREARRDGVPALVREAAILPSEKRVDVLVAVLAPEDDRLGRVMKRDGAEVAAVRSRMLAQTDDARYRERADVVIENDGSLEDLDAKVDALWNRFVEETS